MSGKTQFFPLFFQNFCGFFNSNPSKQNPNGSRYDQLDFCGNRRALLLIHGAEESVLLGEDLKICDMFWLCGAQFDTKQGKVFLSCQKFVIFVGILIEIHQKDVILVCFSYTLLLHKFACQDKPATIPFLAWTNDGASRGFRNICFHANERVLGWKFSFEYST